MKSITFWTRLCSHFKLKNFMAGQCFSGLLQKLSSNHKRLNIDTSVAELQICAYIWIVSILVLLRVFTCKYVISYIWSEFPAGPPVIIKERRVFLYVFVWLPMFWLDVYYFCLTILCNLSPLES